MAKIVKKNNPVMRIIITIIGIALVLMAINDIGLITFGKKATATDIHTSRYSSRADMNKDVNQQYKWTVSWTFNVGGKKYDGRATVNGSSYSVKTNKTIYYYIFAPQINSMYAKDAVGWGTLFYVLIGGFLIVFMNIKPKKSSRFKGKTEKQVAAEMTTYDDLVEEFFDENERTLPVNTDKTESEVQIRSSKFCRNCGAKLNKSQKFCTNCGEKSGNI